MGHPRALVELPNVDNTSDIDKPISLVQAEVLAGKIGKGEIVSFAKDTLLGDGSDEFTKLQALFNKSGIIVMEAGKVYGYTPTATLTLPAGTSLVTNGATFKELASMVDTSTFRVNGNTIIDSLRLDLAGGSQARGLLVAGGQIDIGRVHVKERVQSGFDNYRRRGVVVGIEDIGSNDVNIGSLWAENWDYSAAVFDSTRVKIGSVDVRSFRQGLLTNDVTDSEIANGTGDILSVNALGGAGENTVLIGSTRADYSFRMSRSTTLTPG
jgi:hypothetical protein